MPIRTVKREIRILGLTKVVLDRGMDVLGVVYRGSSLMDGVLYFKAEEIERQGLSRLIKESKHFKQLRVLVLKSDDGFNCEELWRETNIPILCLEGGNVKPYGVSRETALRILHATSRDANEPEALRVACKIKYALEEKFKRNQYSSPEERN